MKTSYIGSIQFSFTTKSFEVDLSVSCPVASRLFLEFTNLSNNHNAKCEVRAKDFEVYFENHIFFELHEIDEQIIGEVLKMLLNKFNNRIKLYDSCCIQ